jgi:hypothetical protein
MCINDRRSGFLVLTVIAARVFELFVRNRKLRFEYRRKDCAMTAAERGCYHALVSEIVQALCRA